MSRGQCDRNLGDDAFGKMRVSQTTTLLDIKHANDKNGTAINGTADQFVLCVRPLSNNADLLAAVNWYEKL